MATREHAVGRYEKRKLSGAKPIYRAVQRAFNENQSLVDEDGTGKPGKRHKTLGEEVREREKRAVRREARDGDGGLV